MTNKSVKEIIKAVDRATEKHGPMSKKHGDQMIILIEELGEMGEAAQDRNDVEYRYELLDLIGAAVRILEVL